MKKRIALLLVLVMTLALFTGCAAKDTTEPKTTTEPEAPEETAEPVELIVFAAASMTETLNQIAEMYKEAAPNVTLVYNFDSSGTLKTQIEEGADCDVFISAAPKQMNALDASRDADGGNADGVISTHTNLIQYAKSLGLFTALRAFLIDSIALDNLVAAGRIRPDALDILPGLMPPMIRRVREQTGLPVLTGGLITQKAEILQALEAGALAISTTDPAVWSM